MDIPYRLTSWCLRQGLSTHLVSPKHDLHNGYFIAEMLSKLYPDYYKVEQFDNQDSTAILVRNWNRIAALAPKIKLKLSGAEVDGCKAGNEQVLLTVLKRIYTLNTGKEIDEPKDVNQPESAVSGDRGQQHKGHTSRQSIMLTNNQPSQAVNQDPLKFLVTRNLDNIQPGSFQDHTNFVTGANLSTIMAAGEPDGLVGASTRRNLSVFSARPSTTAVDDQLGLSTVSGFAGQPTESKYLPRNVPKFVRSSYISTRKLLMELSTACKNAITSLPELQSMMEMIDPRVDTLYPFAGICLRVPSDSAVGLFDALILELKPFTSMFVEQVTANPLLFWEILKLLVLSSINLRRVSGPKTEFPRMATDYLLHLIAEIGRASPVSLALIFNHIIKTRLLHIINLQEFGLYNFIDLYMTFLPVMEHDSALDIVTTLIQIVDANFRERSGGRCIIGTGKLRLAVLTAIVSVISNYFAKFEHDTNFMMFGMFAMPNPVRSTVNELDSDVPSNRSSPRRYKGQDNMQMSVESTQSYPEQSVSTGYGVAVQGEDDADVLSGRELLEQMLVDMLYIIIRCVSGSEKLLLDERIVVLDLLSRCCAANPQELMPYAEPTIFAVFESIVNRTMPYVTIVPAKGSTETSRESSRQGPNTGTENASSNKKLHSLMSLAAGGDLQTIPEEQVKKDQTPHVAAGNDSTKTRRKSWHAPPAVPETHNIVDGLHIHELVASVGQSMTGSQSSATGMAAESLGASGVDKHSPAATASGLAHKHTNDSSLEGTTEEEEEEEGDDNTYSLNCQYDNLPHLHYETLLSLVLILRKYASLCVRDHYDTPLILMSYDLEKVIMELHEQLSPVSLLIGILSSVGRNMEMIKHITPLTIQSILDDKEKAEAYEETLNLLKYIIHVLIQCPDMTEVVFAALDGKGDFEQTMAMFPAHCYLLIVRSLYPGSELMEIVPALLCAALVSLEEFLGNPRVDPNNYFIIVARLIEFIPDVSEFVFTYLSDELFTYITDPQVSETAASLLTDLLVELDGIVDEQELQASIHALIQYTFNGEEALLAHKRATLPEKTLQECQSAVLAFLNSMTMVPSVLALVRDLLIKTDSEDYGNQQLAKFIRSVLEESTGGDD